MNIETARPYGAPDLEDDEPRVEDVIQGMIGTTWIDDYWIIRAASDEPDEPENEDIESCE